MRIDALKNGKMFGQEVETDAAAARKRAEAEAVNLVRSLFREADSGLQLVLHDGRTIQDARTQAVRTYLGEKPVPTVNQFIRSVAVNKVQPAVVAQASAQLQQPPKTRISAVERGDRAPGVLTRAGARAVQALIAAGRAVLTTTLDTGEEYELGAQDILSETLLDPDLVDQLQELTERQRDPMTGMMVDGPLNPEDLIIASDAYRAERLQTIIDKQWELSFSGYTMIEAALMAGVVGDHPVLFNWDVEQRRGRLELPHYLHVDYDPLSRWIHDAGYAILTQIRTVEQVKQQYPHQAEAIEHAQQQRLLQTDTDREGSYSSMTAYSDVEFERPMVIVRTAYIRHHRYPMTEDQALERGLVEQVDVRLADAVAGGQVIAGEQLQWLDGMPVNVDEIEVQESDTGDPYGVDLEGNMLPMARVPAYSTLEGADVAPGDAAWPKELVLAATGQRVKPGDAAWPTREGVRQVRVLVGADILLEDAECPYRDIPVAYLKNIPVPNSPRGIGEPFRLFDIEAAQQRVLTVILAWIENFPFPQEFWPAPMLEALEGAGGHAFQHPGRQIPISAEHWEQYIGPGGRVPEFIKYPPTPPAMLLQLFNRLTELHDELSGHVQVSQGRAPTQQSSGTLAELLLGEVKGIAAYKAQFMSATIEHLVRLWIDAIINPDWMPDDELDKYMADVPAALRPAMRDGMRTLQYDVSVEVTGLDASRRLRHERAHKWREAGAISVEDYLEDTDHPDPKGAMRRRRREIEQESQATAPMAPPGLAPPDAVTTGPA